MHSGDLFLEVRESNVPALQLYESEGFTANRTDGASTTPVPTKMVLSCGFVHVKVRVDGG